MCLHSLLRPPKSVEFTKLSNFWWTNLPTPPPFQNSQIPPPPTSSPLKANTVAMSKTQTPKGMVSTKVRGRGNCAACGPTTSQYFLPPILLLSESGKPEWRKYLEKKNKRSVSLILNFFLKLNFQSYFYSFIKCTLYYIFCINNCFNILERDKVSKA